MRTKRRFSISVCVPECEWYRAISATEQDRRTYHKRKIESVYAHYKIIAVCIWDERMQTRVYFSFFVVARKKERRNTLLLYRPIDVYVLYTLDARIQSTHSRIVYKIRKNIEFQHFIASVENSYNFHLDITHLIIVHRNDAILSTRRKKFQINTRTHSRALKLTHRCRIAESQMPSNIPFFLVDL